MNKAEEYAKIVENCKGTLWSRYYYKHLLRKCKRAAKQLYTGQWFGDSFFNPYIKKRLEDEGFEVKKGKGKQKGRILVSWITDEDEEE